MRIICVSKLISSNVHIHVFTHSVFFLRAYGAVHSATACISAVTVIILYHKHHFDADSDFRCSRS